MLLKSALQKLGRRCFARASTSILSSKGSSHKLESLEFKSSADIFTRSLSSRTQNVCPSYEMKAWYINEYGSNDVLEFGRRPLPTLRRPTDILVRVDAASVNPIDYRMRSGYGETLLNLWRKLENVDEFPLILGRDFSGEVVKTGRMARRFRASDKVSRHALFMCMCFCSFYMKAKIFQNAICSSLPTYFHLVRCSHVNDDVTTWKLLRSSK